MEQTQKPDMGEVIKSILQAEARADEIAEQAKAESKGIISAAEAQAGKTFMGWADEEGER